MYLQKNQEKQTEWILKANQFLTVTTEPIQWQVLVIWSDSIWVLDPSSASAVQTIVFRTWLPAFGFSPTLRRPAEREPWANT